jgi:hypothetical protein
MPASLRRAFSLKSMKLPRMPGDGWQAWMSVVVERANLRPPAAGPSIGATMPGVFRIRCRGAGRVNVRIQAESLTQCEAEGLPQFCNEFLSVKWLVEECTHTERASLALVNMAGIAAHHNHCPVRQPIVMTSQEFEPAHAGGI